MAYMGRKSDIDDLGSGACALCEGRVEFWCNQCKAWFCNSCRKYHGESTLGKDHTFVALEEIMQTLRKDAASGMEQLQQAAGDVEAKLDREIKLRSKTDGEVEEALAAFEHSKADIDRAITRNLNFARKIQENRKKYVKFTEFSLLYHPVLMEKILILPSFLSRTFQQQIC